MKKLRLKALSLGAREILSREQLRSITGGCTSDDDCALTAYCDNGGHCYEAIGSGGQGGGEGSGTQGGGGSGAPNESCSNHETSPGCWVPMCPAYSGGHFTGCVACGQEHC